MLAKCVLTILELNWNLHFRDKKTKLNICHHMLTSSTQLQICLFHVLERTRTSAECPKMKNARAKSAIFFIFCFFVVPNIQMCDVPVVVVVAYKLLNIT